MNENINLINIDQNPLDLFNKWFEEARSKESSDYNAMNLATISDENKPSSRIVLLKSYSEKGFIFYTNKNSKKGTSISFNPNVALNFYWKSIQKQVRIEGIASIINDKESDEYFFSRSKGSQIGAWASKQSSTLETRKELNLKVKEYEERFNNEKMTRPIFWVGYTVVPNLIEFWNKKSDRLHDRAEYIKYDNNWKSRRLYP